MPVRLLIQILLIQELKLFWIGVGKNFYKVVLDYLILDEKFVNEKFISEGGHTWMNCKVYLDIILQKVIQIIFVKK